MFKNAMFYGLEETLISFECMIFIITDLIFGNFTLSAIITFAITQVRFQSVFVSPYLNSASPYVNFVPLQIIRLVFMAIAKSNLTRKGLIDERFLI